MPQPDYENDLVFPPQEIKSQDDLSEQARDTTVLISALEKCQKMEKDIKNIISTFLAKCPEYDGWIQKNYSEYL